MLLMGAVTASYTLGLGCAPKGGGGRGTGVQGQALLSEGLPLSRGWAGTPLGGWGGCRAQGN